MRPEKSIYKVMLVSATDETEPDFIDIIKDNTAECIYIEDNSRRLEDTAFSVATLKQLGEQIIDAAESIKKQDAKAKFI